MEVSLFPNARRPGIGLKPRREAQRPALPQHARHCPVLEAGSTAGHLVYPPLRQDEAFHVAFLGEGRYRFVYYLNPTGARWDGVCAVTWSLPIGGVGTSHEDVALLVPETPGARENALLMARSMIATADLGAPAGAVTLRGAWNIRTPPGWDTVYTPVFNQIERPSAPMLVVRVETDWYVHDSEFRYVLQPGEGVSGSHSLPIGQVLFVPREEIAFRDCEAAEISELMRQREAFDQDKAALTRTTGFGLPYSPHYLRIDRTRHDNSAAEATNRGLFFARPTVVAPPSLPAAMTLKAGRNDRCPCGSGQKFKRCHGA